MATSVYLHAWPCTSDLAVADMSITALEAKVLFYYLQHQPATVGRAIQRVQQLIHALCEIALLIMAKLNQRLQQQLAHLQNDTSNG